MGLLSWLTGDGESKSKAPNTGAHGNSRWGNSEDLDRIDAFKRDIGLPVGYLSGRQFYHPARRKPYGLVLGGTGSGKTTKIFCPLTLSDAASKMSIIGVSTAPDWASICLRHRSKLGPSWRLDPADMLAGMHLGSTKLAGYSPTADFLCASDRLRFPGRAERLTAMCIRGHEGHDRFFYNMAQRALQGAVMAQVRYAPKNCDLPAIAKLFNGDFLSWVRWLLEDPGIDPFIRDLLRPFLVAKGKEFELKSLLDSINTVASEMKWILNEAISDSVKRPDFSFTRFSREVCTAALCVPQNLLADGFDRWLAMVIGCALSELQDSPGDVSTVFLLDELPQYCSETVSKMVAGIYATGRKYNLRVYCAATSLGTLEKDCFQHGRHQDVLGNTGVIHMLNISDPESSRFIKELSGEKTALSVSRSSSSGSTAQGINNSSSRTVTPHSVPVIRAEEVRGIADDSQVVLLDECPYLIYAETKSFKDVPELLARAGQNPFWKEKKPDAQPEKVQKTKKRKPVDEVEILTDVWR
jgi:type IV secretory pathway TraG/TraD family ATPase VirD4